MTRIGIIGAGDVVRRAYLPILSKRSDVEIQSICSLSGNGLESLAEEFGIKKAYTDYLKILEDSSVDSVVIAVPTFLHYPISCRAVELGKNILVEKPLCRNEEESFALLRIAKNYKKVFYAAYNNYFREENQNLLHVVQSGKLGEIERIRLFWHRTWRYEEKSWLYDESKSGGGVLMDLGCHLLHFGLSLLQKRENFSLKADLQNFLSSHHRVEDSVIINSRINDSVQMDLDVSWASEIQTPSKVEIEVFGKIGSISNKDYVGKKSDGYFAMIDDFLLNLQGRKKQDLNLVSDSLKMLFSTYRSAKICGMVKQGFGAGL